MIPADVQLILIAPNVSEQMGGEAIKALQIFRECKKLHPSTVQITHARNREELSGRLALADVYYVEDSWVDIAIWRSVLLRWFLNWWFGFKAVRLARRLASERSLKNRRVIVWQTEPNSPVTPRVLARGHVNCFGPINGNIYYPPIFRRNEKAGPKLRRIFHMPWQWLNRVCFRGLTKADLILCAGGDRTERSLLAAGCPPKIMVDSLDCGIKDSLLARPRVAHAGENLRFIHFGRLVFHKGTALIIRSLIQTKLPIRLDIVGRGPELENCRQLVEHLGLAERVVFKDWYTDHNALFESFADYRGFVLPTLEDANGIVVQEAMALGLPCICLDWGGPQLLVDHGETGFLVQPTSIDAITAGLADYMDRLAADAGLAERISVAARNKAESWRWSKVIRTWSATIGALAHVESERPPRPASN